MIRTLPPLKLTRSPLVVVLAQVKISPVLQMKDYIPRIQEVLRRNDFPRFRENVVQEVLFGPEIKTGTRQRWLFSTEGQTETVVLASDFIVLECSRYTVFEKFAERLEWILEIVRKEVEVALSDRIGLRYVYLIRPSPNELMFEYLKPGLAGLPAKDLGAERLLYRLETIAKTPQGQLVLRVLQTDDGTFLPPGIERTDLSFDIQIGAEELVTILDIDHFSIDERDFKPPELVGDFWKLHDYTDRAFRAAVTPHALSRWEAEELG